MSVQRNVIRIVLPAVLVFMTVAGLGGYVFWRSGIQMTEMIRANLQTNAALSALHFDADELEAIIRKGDVQDRGYLTVVSKLRDIRRSVPNARFVYILRRTSDPKTLAFVADADALSTDQELDVNNNGTVDRDEQAALPGDRYDISTDPILSGPAFISPVTTDAYQDPWGQLVSGYAPILNASGSVVATLGIDIKAATIESLRWSAFPPFALIGTMLLGICSASLIGAIFWRRRTMAQRQIESERMGMIRQALFQFATPVSTLRWWLDILKEQEAEKISPDRQEAYQNIDTAVFKILSMLDHLQRVGDCKLKPEDVSASCRLREAIDLSLKAEGKRIADRKQHVDVSGDLDVQLHGSARLVSSIFAELIHNACSYSPDGSRITIVASAQSGRTVRVRVVDSGIGIAANELPFVGTQFWRSESAKRKRGNGFGIGFAAVRAVVEKLGGSVSIESSLGNGTTVTCTLVRA